MCTQPGRLSKDGQLVTAGGRVLGVVAVADTLPDALKPGIQTG